MPQFWFYGIAGEKGGGEGEEGQGGGGGEAEEGGGRQEGHHQGRPQPPCPHQVRTLLNNGVKSRLLFQGTWFFFRTVLWMRSGREVRASDNQCRSRNFPGFDPSILRHSGIWGATDEAVLNKVLKKIPPFLKVPYCGFGSSRIPNVFKLYVHLHRA